MLFIYLILQVTKTRNDPKSLWSKDQEETLEAGPFQTLMKNMKTFTIPKFPVFRTKFSLNFVFIYQHCCLIVIFMYFWYIILFPSAPLPLSSLTPLFMVNSLGAREMHYEASVEESNVWWAPYKPVHQLTCRRLASQCQCNSCTQGGVGGGALYIILVWMVCFLEGHCAYFKVHCSE